MITARVTTVGDLLLLGPVRGLQSEVPKVVGALSQHAPATLGLGVSPEELQGLDEYFVRADAEPVVPLTTNEQSEVRGLLRFGEVRVPNPSFVAPLRWARSAGTPVEALDPGEAAVADLFAEHIGYVELVRRTVRERRVGRRPPAGTTPDEFALAWDREVAGGSGSRRYAAARDQFLAEGARRLAAEGRRVAVIVDRERFDGVRAQLAPAGGRPA